MASNPDAREFLRNKIDSSKLTSETKEIFSVLLDFFENVIKVKDETIACFETKVSKLQNQVEVLESKLDKNDQYNRRETIVFSGGIPDETPNENCTEKIIRMLEEKVEMKVHPNDICTAHRLGRVTRGGGTKRKIIVKFCRRNLVEDIFRVCRSQRPSFYANCALTPIRNKLFYATRKLKGLYPRVIKSCRAVRGEIEINVDTSSNSRLRQRAQDRATNNRILITSKKQLEEFSTEVLNYDLSSLNINW